MIPARAAVIKIYTVLSEYRDNRADIGSRYRVGKKTIQRLAATKGQLVRDAAG